MDNAIIPSSDSDWAPILDQQHYLNFKTKTLSVTRLKIRFFYTSAYNCGETLKNAFKFILQQKIQSSIVNTNYSVGLFIVYTFINFRVFSMQDPQRCS